MKKYVYWAAICSGILLLSGTLAIPAQIPGTTQTRHTRGQDVSPTYEGWEKNADGTYTMHFGYYNRNSEEDLDVSVGPDNTFDLGSGDQGQPTHFYAGRRWWVFNVLVPKDWPKDKRVVWTLTTHGVTNVAKGWLQPEWEMDAGVVVKNSGRDPFLLSAGGNGEADFDNLRPKITGPSAQTVTLPNTLTLSVTATDDGLPKPIPDPTGRRQPGVRIRWIVYRGPNKLKFDPEIMSGRVYGKPATLESKVSFSEPGVYRLRAIASDGQLTSTYDIDVTVNR